MHWNGRRTCICELSGIIGKCTYIDNLRIVPLFLKTNKSWTVRPTQRSWTFQKSPSHLFHCRSLSKTVRGGAIWLKQVEIPYSEVSNLVVFDKTMLTITKASYVSKDDIESSSPSPEEPLIQPVPVLLQTFGAYPASSVSSISTSFCKLLAPYFTKSSIMSSDTLWTQGDPADGMYIIETGCLRATYAYNDTTNLVQETMVAGTMAGDLSALSETTRNCTVVAERDSVLWKLSKEGLDKMVKEQPEVAQAFTKMVLKGEFDLGFEGEDSES